MSINGNSDVYGQVCNDTADGAGRVENWGYAIARIIEDYNWLPAYHRLVIPVSDEGGYCGSNTTSIRENENCTPFGYNGGIDVLIHSIDLANLQDPIVHISPVLFDNMHTSLPGYGQCLADGTGGSFNSSISNWSVHTINVINATFCDGDGDGHMDCTLVP